VFRFGMLADSQFDVTTITAASAAAVGSSDYSALIGSDGQLNVTAVQILIESFSLEDQNILLEELNIDCVSDLHQSLDNGLLGSGSPDRSSSSRALNVSHHRRPQLEDFYEYRLHKFILLYLPPLFILVGVVGNVLSFMILSRPAMRSVSAYLYLAVLSVTDTLVLFVGLSRLWVAELTGRRMNNEQKQSIRKTNCK